MRKLSWWATIGLIPVFGAATVVSAAQTFKTLANFDVSNGEAPYYGSLVQGFNGNFYGTTHYGGTEDVGTVFEITPAGKLTTLLSFDTSNGSYPISGLVQATNGDLYGTTYEGGTHDYGTVFQITPDGDLTTLHSFDDNDGAYPYAGLVQAANGILYGVTYQGGTDGGGTVFEITTGGKFTSLLSFTGTTGAYLGAYPVGTLIQATNGKLYGTTSGDGTHDGGTVFEVTTAGKLTTLYNFCSKADCTDGESPDGALVQASNGNFYGTTTDGGAKNYGTIFEITAAGELTTLVSFDYSSAPLGAYPYVGLVQATNGNIFGTNINGGSHGFGTIFDITSAGKLTTLVSFDDSSAPAGAFPYGGLLQATNGTFYGTTDAGGNPGDGTVYSLSEGLGPFLETLPTSGAVGAAVVILGNDLTGATSVTFNGKAATFKVVSATEITTNVPSGATTGKVVVKTPTATLTSNVSFNVP
jgi:uncharacterized repeat protein (TIGR03803 family)